MTIRHSALTQKLLRALLGWAVIIALGFHGLIPLGYMPDASHAGQPLAMTICNGMDMSSMQTDDEDNNEDNAASKNKAGEKPSDRTPCAFSVNAVFAFGNLAPDIVQLFYLFIASVAFSILAFTPPRRFGNAGPRAPPLGA